MPRPTAPGVHLVIGGFPPGSTAAHDMHYARLQLLKFVGEVDHVQPTISSNFADLETWLPTSHRLITYTSGPFPSNNELTSLNSWLEGGGRWLALHGTSGGKAEPVDGDRRRRRMVKMPHHDTLGAFFLNRRFASSRSMSTATIRLCTTCPRHSIPPMSCTSSKFSTPTRRSC